MNPRATEETPVSHPSRPLGVGHLTALGLAPPALVTTAAEAGFDSVGLRVLTGNGTERRWPVDVGSPMLLETVRRLEDTGVSVLDVEIVALKPGTAPADYEQALEVGVRLGARFLNVMCDDPDLDRASDTFAGVVERARIYGIRPAIEPMAYKRVSSLSQAAGIARRSDGGGVLLDSLHLRRCGETLDDVRALDPDLLTYVQISDAPRRLPRLDRPAEPLPREQVCGDDPAQVESLTARLPAGDGELGLRELLDVLPPDLAVSVEAPNLELIGSLGPRRFLRRHRDAARALLHSGTPGRRSA
ncbi:sugar phosphate isomerase/epimerase [Saccharopolyspora erythraea NRRL 2338]|uniref:Xylose isomerase-like TIM barrel domain-containing protein n=2 Tax=Saccharopolyspora erythraea TaxID=1836 RepID=A0ABP3MBE9_SACER|nr:sugar phosphate isomerase/epimerase [Saccharopolyspora erythraea]PFG96513.1 sugar phosphate isomerase/epimerase [Saccharopolyspora erythraea NRRL 2338]QRK93004.1 TIM barrel protein [Saccharopolyspora erythraea]